MKRLFLIFFILIPLKTYAQEFTVNKVEELTSDNIAAKDPRYDLNDEICAVLIVEIKVVDNIKFTGNIIGDVHREGNCYRLYCTSGTKRINLMHDDYLPMTIDFAQYSTTIRGGRTYKVSLSASSLQAQSTSYGFGSQYLVIKSSARPLTRVIVNGTEWSLDGGKAKKMVPFGKYEYTAYSDESISKGTVEVTSSATSKVVNVKFE